MKKTGTNCGKLFRKPNFICGSIGSTYSTLNYSTYEDIKKLA
jgi:hypothetical protein